MRMKQWLGAWAVMPALLLAPRLLVGQEVATECKSGLSAFASLGIADVSCDCTLQSTSTGLRWSFRGEPVVERVNSDGPGAGKLRPGDVLVAVDGALITTRAAGDRMSRLQPGDPVTLTIRRNGQTMDVRITPRAACETLLEAPVIAGGPTPVPPLTEVPVTGRPAAPPADLAREAPLAPPALSSAWFGFGITCTACRREVRHSREAESQGVVGWEFREYPRIYSVDPGSPAERAGLQRGDALTHIDGVSLLTPEGGRRFESSRPGQTVTWTYRRNNETRTARMTAGERPLAPVLAMARSEERLAESRRVQAARLAQLDELRSELERAARVRHDSVNAQVLALLERQRALVERQQAELTSPRVADSVYTRLLAREPALVAAAPHADSVRWLPQHLRFAGTVGQAEVEVRGLSSVEVTHDRQSGELLIRTQDATIRIRAQ